MYLRTTSFVHDAVESRASPPLLAEEIFEPLDPDQDQERDERGDHRPLQPPGADERSDRGEEPDDRRRGDPDDPVPPRHDHPGAEEADPGDDLAQYPGGVDAGGHHRRSERDEEGGPEADEDAGTHPRDLAAELAFESDGATAETGGADMSPEDRRTGVECGGEVHRGSREERRVLQMNIDGSVTYRRPS